MVNRNFLYKIYIPAVEILVDLLLLLLFLFSSRPAVDTIFNLLKLWRLFCEFSALMTVKRLVFSFFIFYFFQNDS